MGATLMYGALARRYAAKRHRKRIDERRVGLGTSRCVGNEIEAIVVPQEHHGGRVTAEQPQAALDDGVENRLNISQRARYRSQDLRRGGLLIKRGRQISIAR